MSTYTNNNNAIDFSSIQGPQGPVGYSGSVGPIGPTGEDGVIQGPQGQPDLIRTDISFSGGEISESGNLPAPGLPYRLIKEGKIRFVGSFVYDKQEGVRTGTSIVKVLVSATSETRGDVEIGLCLNGNKPDSNGETRIAHTKAVVSGTGVPQDATIVQVNRVSSSIAIDQYDTISLWAYIKPTDAEMQSVIDGMLNDPDVTTAEATYYIDETYRRPYDMSTPDAFYWALLNDYNIKNTDIPPSQRAQMQTTLQNYLNSLAPNVSLPAIEEEKLGTLKVHYLQIL
jgi:hypothetical protein